MHCSVACMLNGYSACKTHEEDCPVFDRSDSSNSCERSLGTQLADIMQLVASVGQLTFCWSNEACCQVKCHLLQFHKLYNKVTNFNDDGGDNDNERWVQR